MEKKARIYKLIVIGGGPAGIAAAIHAKSQISEVLLIEKKTIGGRIDEIPLITNYIGIFQIEGEKLASSMREQVLKTEILTENLEIKSICKKNNIFVVGNQRTNFYAHSIIVATGSSWKKLDLKRTEISHSKNISYRVNGDSHLAKNKNILIVGGGYSGCYAANFLTKFAEKVYLVHSGESLAVNAELEKTLAENKKVEVYLESVPLETEGESKLEACIILTKNVLRRKLEIDLIFPCIGNVPNSWIIKDYVKRTPTGVVIVEDNFESSIKGLFAVGDVASKSNWQITTAIAEGVQAAQAATKYLLQKS